MPRFEETRDVGAPAAVCFELLTDPDRIPDWLTIASEVDAAGDGGVGRRLHARGSAMGADVDLELEVTAWEPPTRYAWRSAGPVTVAVTHELEPEGSVCHLRTAVDADVGRHRSLRARVAIRVLRGEVSRSLDRLVELAESTPA